jgi:hypothetical protein
MVVGVALVPQLFSALLHSPQYRDTPAEPPADDDYLVVEVRHADDAEVEDGAASPSE